MSSTNCRSTSYPPLLIRQLYLDKNLAQRHVLTTEEGEGILLTLGHNLEGGAVAVAAHGTLKIYILYTCKFEQIKYCILSSMVCTRV